ncbi:DUF1800 domain-containing protein [Pararhodobacter oceanensis]|nr:DUF1800 domain-containing protein [Pararhodobacter oceanensis]
MREIASFIALNRFGLGAAPGDEAHVAGDPRGWLQAQITPDPRYPLVYARRRSSADILHAIFSARQEGAEARAAAIRRAFRREYNPAMVARLRLMIASDTPFVDRMTLFWSNHFTLSTTRRVSAPAIPAYEREAIRPHIFGRFSDMLRAVISHPCMLIYLDNVASAGPNSPVGRRQIRRRGTAQTLNENLAREVLELHTLGVTGGYTQADIIALAKALSGWGHGGMDADEGETEGHGGFAFLPRYHEPGAKTVLGRRYEEAGVAEGMAILDDLARHPATAQHIATKLVRHFVADDPPAAAVAQIATVFRDSDGDLGAVSRALINLDAAWVDPLAKVKSPIDYVLSVHRASERIRATRADLFVPLQALGQLPFSAPSPQGWGDTAADWIAPESLMRRIEWARGFAATLPATRHPEPFLEAVIGPVASAETRTWVRRAPSHDAALALIFASPEFQRR